MKKKITSIILSVVLMTSMLAACTGGSQSSNGQTQNKSVESQESGEERTSYKVVLVRPSEGSLDFLETSVLQELEEKYNVDIIPTGLNRNRCSWQEGNFRMRFSDTAAKWIQMWRKIRNYL